ncbi:prolyl oligopeptidase family serine peptidase [Actinoplanes sp. ATCC 53533]|uniref:S9 family peptidase n=1 Tax=Actinoplanes sp. ATCC 53533 TaxID=1288362 RepID=UPI001F472D84|nr:prolyl oligopeptidase family serine peptidase [Actinoplanes sp. ATCC 53533]
MIEDSAAGLALTADQVARAGTSIDWLTSAGGVLHWVEASPEVGRAVVASWDPSSGASGVRISGLPEAGVGSSLHAYGGMPYTVLPALGVAVVDGSTGQIAGDVAVAATAHTYGDLAQSGGELLCVREDSSGDELVAIDLTTGALRVLRTTDGFLASPRAAKRRLAWVQWGAGVMPWDSSEVWVADYAPGGGVGAAVRVAGGPDESVVQPQWAQDGSLYFLSDRTGWWNLYRWRDGRTEAVAPMAAECATAPWESGYANYALLLSGRIGVIVQRGPEHELVIVEPDGRVAAVETPYTSIKPFLAAMGDRIALIGASPTRASEIALVATDGSARVEVIRRGPGDLVAGSVPEIMRIRSGQAEVTALFYPPAGDVRPAPLIVRAHSGPTYHSDLRLDGEVQFFTSRGFAVVDVDYRGSTGYGRAFRKALDGSWGRSDVEDCRNVTLHLLAVGRAMPEAVFISGASAGGFTALRAACEDGPFRLAVARSAIVDPQRWTTTAPRFQRPHAAILAHDGARVAPERVRRPVLLIHGGRDDVAPIGDVTQLATALQERKLLAGMLTLENVGHYLSAPAAQAAALDAELDAYLAVLTEAGLALPS